MSLTEKFAMSGIAATVAVAIGITVWVEIDAMSLTEGEVLSKSYSAAWVELQRHGSGNTAMTIPVHHPEQFWVTIHGLDPKGEFKQRTVAVPREIYLSLTNGQTYRP